MENHKKKHIFMCADEEMSLNQVLDIIMKNPEAMNSISNIYPILKYSWTELTKEQREYLKNAFSEQFEIEYNKGTFKSIRKYDDFIRDMHSEIKDFLLNNEDATEQDFFATELQEIKESTIEPNNPNIFLEELCLNNVLSESLLNKIMYSQKRKIEFLEKLTGNYTTNDASNIEWYPKIFSTQKDFELFELLMLSVKDVIADYSYFYRRMHNEDKIHVKPTPFARWLNDTYEIADLIPKVKTLTQCETEAKKNIYETTKLLYKTQNNP